MIRISFVVDVHFIAEAALKCECAKSMCTSASMWRFNDFVKHIIHKRNIFASVLLCSRLLRTGFPRVLFITCWRFYIRSGKCQQSDCSHVELPAFLIYHASTYTNTQADSLHTKSMFTLDSDPCSYCCRNISVQTVCNLL